MMQEGLTDVDLPPVADQKLKAPIAARGLNDGLGVTYYQPAYSLTEVDFIHLKSSSTKTQWLANVILGAWGGYALGLGPKFVDSAKARENLIAGSEWQVLIAILVIGVLIWLAGLILPNDRSKLLNKIKLHFKNNPPEMKE